MLSVPKVSVNSVNFKSEKTPFDRVSFPDMESGFDKVDIKSDKKPEPPKISRLRLFFGVLTDKQIEGINESGKLPKNAKFEYNGFGGYTIGNNYMNVAIGTREMPAGFEVQKNILGFATVVPKGSESIFLKK